MESNSETKVLKGNRIPRVDMPCQPANVRNKNFEEVATGYTAEMAMKEATRCWQCRTPKCRKGCPVEVRIPEFIKAVAHGNFQEAYDIIKMTNALPAVCGRVCPQENQCEGQCIVGIKGEAVAIGRLERFVADYALNQLNQSKKEVTKPTKKNVKIACLGSGPASLTCAGHLANLGAEVTIFEALHEAGGVLIYGIPEFRLPKSLVAKELEGLKELGVDIKVNWVAGRTIEIPQLLKEGYDAVFIGVGAGLPIFLNIAGESLLGVFSANEYLTRANLGRAYAFPKFDTPTWNGKRVTVYGAGNVAMDAARTAIRMGAENVSIVYRRTKNEMPARHEEIEHALEEGVELIELVAPLRFIANDENILTAVELEKMALGEPDDSGRRRPNPTGEKYIHETDLAIIALGTRSNPILLEATPELELNKWKYIVANPETNETSMPNVYAGGDIVTGAATVIQAMGAGRTAAQAIAKKFDL